MDTCCCKCVRVEVVESRVDVDILDASIVSYDQSEYVPMQTAVAVLQDHSTTAHTSSLTSTKINR